MPLPLVFGLLTLVLVCTSRAVLNDGDTFMHVAAGGWMFDHGAVLRGRAEAGARWGWVGWPAIASVVLLRLATPFLDGDSRVAPVSAVAQLPPGLVRWAGALSHGPTLTLPSPGGRGFCRQIAGCLVEPRV